MAYGVSYSNYTVYFVTVQGALGYELQLGRSTTPWWFTLTSLQYKNCSNTLPLGKESWIFFIWVSCEVQMYFSPRVSSVQILSFFFYLCKVSQMPLFFYNLVHLSFGSHLLTPCPSSFLRITTLDLYKCWLWTQSKWRFLVDQKSVQNIAVRL